MSNVIYIEDGQTTVGTMKDIEQSLKDELIEYLENREDILGEDTQADWNALFYIEKEEWDDGLYKLTFDPDHHFHFEITKLTDGTHYGPDL